MGSRSRPAGILRMASAEDQRPLASEWLVTAPFGARTTIPDDAYRMAIRKRLDVPVCSRGDACRVQKGAWQRGRRGVPPPRGQMCGAMLMAHADHAQACATHARDVRHDALADLAAAINREAGCTAHREAEVPGVLSKTKKDPIRADVLVRARAPAAWECTEVKIRHLFTSDGDLSISRAADIDEFLRAQEARVHNHYAPARVRPWVFTSLGRPGAAFCTDLRRLARQRLQRQDVRDAVSVPSVHQFLLHRWRAELSCALVTGDVGVYMAAVAGGPAGAGREPPRAEMQVYDLLSARMTF